MDNSVLIENIKTYCALKKLTPTSALVASGVGRSFIADLRRGQTPSVAKVQALAAYLGVTTSQLLGEKEPPVEDERPNADVRAAQLRLADDLYDRLTPENRAKADSYLAYLLAEQAGPGDKR